MSAEPKPNDGRLFRLVVWSLMVRPLEGARRAKRMSVRAAVILLLPLLLSGGLVFSLLMALLERYPAGSFLYSPETGVSPVWNEVIRQWLPLAVVVVFVYPLLVLSLGIGVTALTVVLRKHLSEEDIEALFPPWVPIPFLGPILGCGLRLVESRKKGERGLKRD